MRGKLGLIAGGGELPERVAARCEALGRSVFILRLAGYADSRLAQRWPGVDIGLGEFGRSFAKLREEACESICFVGRVARPNFAALRLDATGLRLLPSLIAAAREGDDRLLRRVLQEFERAGFKIEGAEQVDDGLILGEGPLGAIGIGESHRADADRALAVAGAIGDLDIGQGAVVVRGLVLAVEAQEGTDAMLHRCAGLPAELRAEPGMRLGVLAKAPKPIQDRRVDLPVIGRTTVEAAAAAGLAGIVAEAHGALLADRPAVIETADRLGVFVVGVPRPRLAGA